MLREILRELDDKVTSDELDMMIQEIDSDGSGTVDFDGKGTRCLVSCRFSVFPTNSVRSACVRWTDVFVCRRGRYPTARGTAADGRRHRVVE